MSEFVIGDVLQLQKQNELEDAVSLLSSRIDSQRLGQRFESPQGRATLREQFKHSVGDTDEIPTFEVEREGINHCGCDVVHMDSYRPLGRHYAYGIGFEPIVDLSFDIYESCCQVPYV